MSCGEESLSSSPPSDQECTFFFNFKVAQTLCFPSQKSDYSVRIYMYRFQSNKWGNRQFSGLAPIQSGITYTGIPTFYLLFRSDLAYFHIYTKPSNEVVPLKPLTVYFRHWHFIFLVDLQLLWGGGKVLIPSVCYFSRFLKITSVAYLKHFIKPSDVFI